MTEKTASIQSLPVQVHLRNWLSQVSTVLILLGGVALIFVITDAIGSLLLTRFVTQLFIDIVLVIGLQVFMGNSNILWFPHTGFMGIGAYASVIFIMGPMQEIMSLPELYPFLSAIDMGFLPGLLCGAVVAAAVAAVVCFPMMRLSDFPAVIAGFALLVVSHVIFVNWSALTNGPQTLFGIERHTYITTAALWAGITIVIGYLFKESKVGLQLRASREDLVAARTSGINIIFIRWLGVILGAFIAGIGGGLYAHYITAFMPDAFYLGEMFVILSMLVIGGPATISGAVFGAFIVTVFYQSLRWLENSEAINAVLPGGAAGLSTIALALALIGMLIWRPSGIIERNEISANTLGRMIARVRRRLNRSPQRAKTT